MVDVRKDFRVSVKGDKSWKQYAVGPLLYTPALNEKIAEDLCGGKYPDLTSLALCLEDSICDEHVSQAEDALEQTLKRIAKGEEENPEIRLPLLFIRVRNPKQLKELFYRLKDYFFLITGFVLPKFDLSNAQEYRKMTLEINRGREKNPIYIMPILESDSIIHLESRRDTLMVLKPIVDSISEFVLNIRLGGNDFCRRFGLRRGIGQNIYEIAVVRDTIADVFNVFGRDYVVSGPVWEYFDNHTDDLWRRGLEQELELDRLNGLVGKTAIHPSQLSVILESLQVDETDFLDAKRILNFESVNGYGVEKSVLGHRMNEFKVEELWASKMLILAEIYGVKKRG